MRMFTFKRSINDKSEMTNVAIAVLYFVLMAEFTPKKLSLDKLLFRVVVATMNARIIVFIFFLNYHRPQSVVLLIFNL